MQFVADVINLGPVCKPPLASAFHFQIFAILPAATVFSTDHLLIIIIVYANECAFSFKAHVPNINCPS